MLGHGRPALLRHALLRLLWPHLFQASFSAALPLQALSYTSIGILAIFTAELVAKLLVFGITYFTHSK